MQVFSIRDVENLTGIKAHTIRIWEQRYQLMSPIRKPGNHRIYDSEDLRFLLRVSSLYHRGFKISKIAQCSPNELDKLILETQATDAPYQIYVNQLLDCVLDFDPVRFDQIIDACLEQYGFVRSIQSILFPFLIRIGLLWLTNHVIPAQEHFASNIILKRICAAIEQTEPRDFIEGIHVVLFTPQNEFHELPILMTHYLLKERGIRSTYFGTDASVENLKSYCLANGVTHLYTHIITHLQKHDPEEFTATLSSAFPQQKIVISGTLAQQVKRNFLNVHLIQEEFYMQSFMDYILK